MDVTAVTLNATIGEISVLDVVADTVPEVHATHVAPAGVETAVGVVEYETASVPLAPGTAVTVHGNGID
ncbi:hypothetical protein, partial [Lactococcus petauri]|uniref:hypothetical protein n=1 Tax=Lactococcus petauri TaxID=1940789 RepID=UPI0021F16A90